MIPIVSMPPPIKDVSMKTTALILATLTSLSAPAAATISVTAVVGAPDPGSAFEKMVVDFDGPNAPGFEWNGAPATYVGTRRGYVLAPAGVTDRFGFVAGGPIPPSATLLTPALQSVSFYWGWMNPRNRVELLDLKHDVMFTIGAAEVPRSGPWDAAQANRRVFFVAAPGSSIYGLRFVTRDVGFEFDSIMAEPAYTKIDANAGVPEPASWAMLIAGLGLVGAMRRRVQVVLA